MNFVARRCVMALAVAACAGRVLGRGTARDDAAIADAEQRYVDLVVETSPETATAWGLYRREAELDDRTAAGVEAALGRKERMLAELRRRFARPRASRAALVDLELLLHTLDVDTHVERALRPDRRQPDFYTAPMQALFLMTARDYAPAEERARNLLLRIDGIPAVVAAAKANLLDPPRIWTRIGIEQADSARSFFDEQKAFLVDALPGARSRIDGAIAGAEGAYADYARFLREVVLPRSGGDFAAGQDLFGFLLREGYFLDEDADHLFELGRSLMQKTENQLVEVARRIDAKASWPDVLARLKTKHPPAAGLLDAYRAEVRRARDFLVGHGIFDFPAGETLDVVPTPAFQRNVITAAYDQPPPFGKSAKGLFFVTPVDPSSPTAEQEEMLREHDQGDLVDTAVHEAYPGHHLQLSLARLHPSLIRKVVDAAIFSEGWGLYSEELMAELGYYTDEERLMQLQWTLVRAARIVLDVGLHTRGMSFDDAVRLLTDEVHLERPLAESEVKRYTESPTQPLSYLVGREAIFRIRKRYLSRCRAEWASCLRRFHMELLSHGSIAPALVEREMFGD
jgi:uncharacterized protein (DUF885 family)